MGDLPEWARRLDLSTHPEGGWFRETWRSDLTVPHSALPPDHTGPRNAGPALLLLPTAGQQSAGRTVRSPASWAAHSGGHRNRQDDIEHATPQRNMTAPAPDSTASHH